MPNFDALIAKREAARRRGDFGVVQEINTYLERNGYVESVVPEATERAVPPRPRRKK